MVLQLKPGKETDPVVVFPAEALALPYQRYISFPDHGNDGTFTQIFAF